jgi:hypothetical protein
MKKLNTDLLKILIETDFGLLFSSKNLDKNFQLRSTDNVLKSSIKENNAVSLDILVLIKCLKQIIRFLQFIKKKKLKLLHICISNVQYLNFLNLYFKKVAIQNILSIKGDLRSVNARKNFSQFVLLLDEAPLLNNEKFLKKIMEDKIYLAYKINSKTEFYHGGTYKMYNNFSDFKKIVFLLVLLREILL